MSPNLEQKSPLAGLWLINTGNDTAGKWRINQEQTMERDGVKRRSSSQHRDEEQEKNWNTPKPSVSALFSEAGGKLVRFMPLSLTLASLLLLPLRGYAKMLPFSIR